MPTIFFKEEKDLDDWLKLEHVSPDRFAGYSIDSPCQIVLYPTKSTRCLHTGVMEFASVERKEQVVARLTEEGYCFIEAKEIFWDSDRVK